MAIAASALIALACGGLARPASAQVSKDDLRCIATFNKSVRKVVKAHARLVHKCLSNFAAGRLASATPEACIASDPRGKVAATIAKETDKINRKCPSGLPGFGVSTVSTALTRAVLAQFDLVHGTIGPDLDINLIPNKDDASCQAKVGAALLKCEDTHLREYLKCQKKGLKAGAITDGASLAAECLGAGNDQQPDDAGRIARACATKVADTVAKRCADSDLSLVFAPCDTTDPNSLSSCLTGQSACQVCRLLNDVDGLARDCDSFDDGNPNNGSCGAECGDGLVHTDEACDDGGTANGDGCSSTCTVEGGWTCTGEPSVCTQNCGNGTLDAGEACDDGGTANGDGCSNTCEIESGYECSGEPSVCVKKCGNGTIQPANGEVCDDGGTANGDGCSSTCQVEPGYNCSGQPSICTFVCGDGTFQSGETCDDHNAVAGDGCSAVCQIEQGWLCSGVPSTCTPICGDGLKRGTEACDDGNATSGDGCSFSCQVETGYSCSGQPSHCSAVCGDGFIRGLENCDDNNTTSGDGCSGDFCRQETGNACLGQPSVCVALCGNGTLDALEQCDDGNTTNGDGCAGNCTTEPGYACVGTLCLPTCGNGVLDSGEECDDGNSNGADGCSSSCKIESGWLCDTPGQSCDKFDVFIDSPANGVFTTASSITISGHYTVLPAGQVSIKVNGVPASSVNTTARTFSHTISLSSAQIFNPVLVTLTNTASGDDVRDRIVVIDGQSVADGAYSPMSVAMRLNDTGLDAVEPLVGALAAGQFNLGTLLPPGTPITSGCFIDSFLGCLGSATVTIANPAPSYSNLSLAMDSKVNYVYGDITIHSLRIDVNINGSGLVPSCGLRLTASSLDLTGNYSLEPLASDPSSVDVNLIGSNGVVFSGFNHQFTSGLCDAPIIGDIIQALLPDIQQLTTDGIAGFLGDPDGSGPADSPIAAGIQTVIGGINITGPIGSGIGLMLQTPLFEVAEDNAGITFGSDSRFTVSVGNGPGQCIPPLGAPDLTASYARPEAFPTFGANTPAGNVPYGFGICISSAGFNQLLRGQTECGLMRSSITDIDIDGSGPLPSVAINSTLLSAFIPEFGQLPPNTPLRIDIAPTLAPIVTGNVGPNGELTELKLAQLIVSVVQPSNGTVWLSGAVDTRLGMDLAFLPDGSGLAITISPPLPGNLSFTVVDNPLGTNESQVETVLPGVIQPLLPDLAGALSGFPLPQFFGLQLNGVEVSRNGQFMSLFANLNPAP